MQSWPCPVSRLSETFNSSTWHCFSELLHFMFLQEIWPRSPWNTQSLYSLSLSLSVHFSPSNSSNTISSAASSLLYIWRWQSHEVTMVQGFLWKRLKDLRGNETFFELIKRRLDSVWTEFGFTLVQCAKCKQVFRRILALMWAQYNLSSPLWQHTDTSVVER